MPASRVSGATHVAFAKGVGRGGLIWVTVVSTEDCRLVGGRLQMRILLQNVWGGGGLRYMVGTGLRFVLKDGVSIDVDEKRCLMRSGSSSGGSIGSARVGRGRLRTAEDKELPFRESRDGWTTDEYKAFVTTCLVERAGREKGVGPSTILKKDDFAVLTVEVQVPGARFEVDALERLASLYLPVVRLGGGCEMLVAKFHDKVLWDSYERLPGGWWVRKDVTSAHRF